MILKSFFRKKIIIVYSIIFIVLITSIINLNSFINYLNSIEDHIYSENSFLVVTSKTDYYDIYKNNKHILDIQRSFIFEPNYDKEQIFKKSDDYIAGEDLSWFYVINYDLGNNKIVVYSDASKDFKLKSDEVSLGFEDHAYETSSIEDIKEKFLNEKVTFKYQNKDIDLNISNIYQSGDNPEITISDTCFQELLKESEEYTNILIVDSEQAANKIQTELKMDKDTHVSRVWGTTLEDDKIIEKTNKSLFTLKIANYIIISILGIMIFIINKNILEDLQNNFSLERKIGFKPFQIKKNTLKRLLILHTTNIFISLIFSSLILKIIKVYFNLNAISLGIINSIIVSCIIILYDIFLSLTIKIK